MSPGGPHPGFSRADLHVHTTFSDGTATPEDVLNFYAIRSGIRVLAITDHDTLDGALHAKRFAADHPDLFGHLDVIVGEEVTSRDGHIVGLFLDEWVPPGLSAAETVDAIHAQGGLAVAAHPYTSWMRWSGLVGVGDLIRTVAFDGVETRNSNFTEVFANGRAERRAGDKARVGSSDGHFLAAIGGCYTEFPGETAADLRAALLARTTIAGGGCYGLPTLVRYAWGRLRAGAALLPRRLGRQHPGPGSLEVLVSAPGASADAVLTLSGRLDAAAMPSLKRTLQRLSAGRVGVVLDLEDVSFLDSSGITALVAGFKGARLAGVGFTLRSPSAPVRRALDTAGLTRVFPLATRARAPREAQPRKAAVSSSSSPPKRLA